MFPAVLSEGRTKKTHYDPEETFALTAASTLCLSMSFNDACGEFVKSKLLNYGGAGKEILALPEYDLFCLESTSQQPTTNGNTSGSLTA